ncbi:hypothetical protein RP20_CCG019431 [Aedes albopictus]|nr:hypothetical protein RP20_CCG019431 [Aedes albopictus]
MHSKLQRLLFEAPIVIPICEKDLDKLLQTEGIILKQLDSYIQAQEERLGELKRRTFSWKTTHSKATRNAKDYLLNPVNAFLLIKRLTLEWNDIEIIANAVAKQDLMSPDDADKKPLELPERVDLLGAMDALLRLQDVYNLDASAIANGIGTGSKMLADDCFELGQKLQETGDTHHAADWFREAYNRFDLGKIDLNKKVKILEYLASYSYTTGNVEDALDYTDYLLDLQPDNKKALGQKTFYEDAIWDQQDKVSKMSDVTRGGATVFPKLNFALEARKGSAVFWYNLHSSGNLDYSTLHGACPVLIGEKWVANKWIRERGQEFRRKCDPDDME